MGNQQKSHPENRINFIPHSLSPNTSFWSSNYVSNSDAQKFVRRTMFQDWLNHLRTYTKAFISYSYVNARQFQLCSWSWHWFRCSAFERWMFSKWQHFSFRNQLVRSLGISIIVILYVRSVRNWVTRMAGGRICLWGTENNIALQNWWQWSASISSLNEHQFLNMYNMWILIFILKPFFCEQQKTEA